MPGHPVSAFDRILDTLERSGMPHRIHAHAASVTFKDAADYLDFPPAHLLKTIAFRVKDGPWVLAAVRGRDRVDYKKLAAHLGINRTRLASLPPEQVESELGYPLGGVAPFPTCENTRVLFDTRATILDVVYCGTGRNDRTLEIDAHMLLAVCGGEIADIAAAD